MGSPVHLAQINIGRLAAPIDSPQLVDFVAALDTVNALAEASPGFVWRLIGEGNDATSLRPFPDPDVIVNMSVWESADALYDFVYRSAHTPFLRRRREWFTPVIGAAVGAWSVPVGHIPSLGEARSRLDHMSAHGSSAYCHALRDNGPSLVIERTDLRSALARELIGELNTDIESRYESENTGFFSLDPEEVKPGSGGYFVAWLDGAPVGCGAARTLDDGSVELKRMYTRPCARGHGVGKAMVSHLIGITRDLGRTRIVLETGPAQAEAIGVYERAGFTSIPLFGQYIGSITSLCYELLLT
jgi:GNAT superfamily N-acetyltransferase